ncbi:polysaccharide pyruvyl transferase family protein [Microbacterium yannicii]|uniref:Polysaccharide pyruvyl transferase family protein n=1 Tax=Microbacterium yannicii TaxID=671622 RepID=A0ABP9MA87_9MICO|nr:polysaccharide pyruvyl transferase family protein [Microbacterium yannicii]MCO5952794.1 polysaccharide pyruvyl transferase family protein [Microbacterium yannicii]
MVDLRGVDLFNWNPSRPIMRGPVGRLLPFRRPVNNFGDMLGPVVATELAPSHRVAAQPIRLLSVGSVLHFARDGDVVWGSGINGKVNEPLAASVLDVRAVRGPLTARVLTQRGISVPSDAFGDPGALAPALFGVERSPQPRLELTSLPNLHDYRLWADAPGLISPRLDYLTVLRTIADSKRIVTSSLHGIIIADALGIDVSLVRPTAESMFKYEDYYEGTGRRLPSFSTDRERSLESIAPKSAWDPTDLVNSFPRDLWSLDPSEEAARSGVT